MIRKIEVIAEIGWNHCGDMQLAKDMAKAAKESGATYAKYQTWSVDRLKPGSWDEDGRKEIYENLFDTYKNVDSIHDRLDVLIRLEIKNGDFTEEEEVEFVELKRLRSIIDPKYKLFK